jgi:hypothetical protein
MSLYLPVSAYGVRDLRPPPPPPPPPWYTVAGHTCIAAYQPIGAASYAASLVNLANPGTYDAVDGVAPSWDAGTGWTFDGSDDYLTTGVIPAAGYSVLVQFTNAGAANDKMILGLFQDVDKRFGFAPHFEWGYNGVYYAAGDFVGVSPYITDGNLGIAGQTAYRNGVADGGAIGGSISTTGDVYIGARHRVDTAGVDSYCAVEVQAVVFYADTLDATEMATVAAAMAAL